MTGIMTMEMDEILSELWKLTGNDLIMSELTSALMELLQEGMLIIVVTPGTVMMGIL